MIALRNIGRLVAGIVALSAATTAEGQVIKTDTDGWSVACTVINGGNPTSRCNGAFSSAVRVNPTADGWATGPISGAYWISNTGTGSLWSSSPDEGEYYEYTFRTYIDLAVGSSNTLAINFNSFHFDNYFVGVRVNGHNTIAGFEGGNFPLPAPGENWTKSFVLNTTSNKFVEGQNTLDIVIRGNGRTDGILVAGSYYQMPGASTVVPEPSTVVLMTAGLAGLGVAMRRRKRSNG